MVAYNGNRKHPDLEPIENDFDDDGAEEIQLEPGENVVGEIREINTGLGDYNSTLIHIARDIDDVVKLWSNRQIDAQMGRAALPGTEPPDIAQ